MTSATQRATTPAAVDRRPAAPHRPGRQPQPEWINMLDRVLTFLTRGLRDDAYIH